MVNSLICQRSDPWSGEFGQRMKVQSVNDFDEDVDGKEQKADCSYL